MSGQKTISSTFQPVIPPPPPPPIADYHVEGTITPDATGDYFEDGVYGGEPAYRNADSSYWIWYDTAGHEYWISIAKGDTLSPGWVSSLDQIETTYNPANGATGEAKVISGPA